MSDLLRDAGLRLLSWLVYGPPGAPELPQPALDSLPVESPPCCAICPLHREWLLHDAYGHVVLPRQRIPATAAQFYFGILTLYYAGGRA